MKKRAILILTMALFLGLTGCFGNGDVVNDLGSSGSGNSLYIKVVDRFDNLLRADSITLLDIDSHEVVDYKTNSHTIEFTDLKEDTYLLVVGREDYRMKKEEINLNQDSNLKISLESGGYTTQLDVQVNDQAGNTFYSSLDIQLVVKDGDLDNQSYEKSYSPTDFEIWPGVIYGLKVDKEGYDSFYKFYLNIEEEFTDSIKLKLYSQGDYDPDSYSIDKKIVGAGLKEIDLGILQSDEHVIVAVSPLNYQPMNNKFYHGTVQAEGATSTNASIQGLIQVPELEQNDRLTVQSMTDDITPQNRIDHLLREKEIELLNKYGKDSDKGKVELMSSSPAQEDEFQVYDFDRQEYETVEARLEAESKHALIYVDKSINFSYASELAYDFNSIYQKDMDYFGDPQTDYDHDDNDKVIILLTPLGSQVGGYFDPVNFYDDLEGSNQADMIYLNSSQTSYRELKRVMAHELEHLIFFVEKQNSKRTNADSWINEGFAQLAEKVNGLYSGTGDAYFLDPADESLIYWDQKVRDYDAAYLFVSYLLERESSSTIRGIIQSSRPATEFIDRNVHGGFDEFLMDWQIANYLSNDFDIYNFDYTLPGSNTPPVDILEGVEEFRIRPNGVKYYRINGNGSRVTLKIDSDQKMGISIIPFEF